MDVQSVKNSKEKMILNHPAQIWSQWSCNKRTRWPISSSNQIRLILNTVHELKYQNEMRVAEPTEREGGREND
jgi:hypothetical protein